jgi:phage terminase large subunit
LSEEEAMKMDLSGLVDIRDVEVDERLSVNDKIQEYIRQIKNPYMFRYGKTKVRIRHAETGTTFEERVKNYFDLR